MPITLALDNDPRADGRELALHELNLLVAHLDAAITRASSDEALHPRARLYAMRELMAAQFQLRATVAKLAETL